MNFAAHIRSWYTGNQVDKASLFQAALMWVVIASVLAYVAQAYAQGA